MSGTIFRLYRVNFVDREQLFDQPVVTDEDVLAVFLAAALDRHDLSRSRTRHRYRWSIRGIVDDKIDEANRPYIYGVFSLETTYRTGPIVRPEGVVYGTSEISPPMAIPVRFFVDLQRHVIAFGDVPSVMQQKTGWQRVFELILSSAAHDRGFTSRVVLEPIAPKQVIEQRISTFERVTRLRLTLRIPNPDLGPTYKKLYDEMRENGIRELTEDMRGERGLEMGPNSIPRMAIDMALSGYRKGNVRIYGRRDGQRDEFTIADDVARIDLRELRSYVEGMEVVSSKASERKLLAAIISRIDETLGRRLESNDHDEG
jgi:hypothetical protein